MRYADREAKNITERGIEVHTHGTDYVEVLTPRLHVGGLHKVLTTSKAAHQPGISEGSHRACEIRRYCGNGHRTISNQTKRSRRWWRGVFG